MNLAGCNLVFGKRLLRGQLCVYLPTLHLAVVEECT